MASRVGSRLRRLALLGVVLHALVVAAAPFEHHDLICHLKTPQHCSSCTWSPVGSQAHGHAPTVRPHLSEAGEPAIGRFLLVAALLTASTTGRSPPAA